MIRHTLQALFIFITTLFSLLSSGLASANYVGSEQCKGCHSEQYTQWQQSHHFLAMNPATKEYVLGDFNNAHFEYAGITHRFFKQGQEYLVETDNAAGKKEVFKITYVFGFTPLQQYLIKFNDGRFQTLSISWDARSLSEGGQRWFHLYPDEKITHDNPLHWTGYFQNWNSRCASCHSTNLRKNYDQDTNTYATTFSEMNVGCEACHGEADKHISWAKKPSLSSPKILPLSDGGEWRMEKGQHIAKRIDNKRPRQQTETCAACHSLRGELSDQPSTGKPFHDNYQLRLLEEPHYYPDGQINEEVYVYGSFLQSKMSQAGVVCSDCHNPHSTKLKGEGNTVCLQCHDSSQFSPSSHHQHKENTPGSFCVDCHMPEKTYMGVDPRRDHSFSLPNPINSKKHNTPNACASCHKNTETLAEDYMRLFGAPTSNQYLELLTAARLGTPKVLNHIVAYIQDKNNAPIKRATMLTELSNFPSQLAFKTSMQMLQSQHALIRRAAIGSLSYVPPEKRNGYVSLLKDPDKSVRMQLAPFLAPMPTERLPDVIHDMYADLVQEYFITHQNTADMPSAQLNLANFYLTMGAGKETEKALDQALILSPGFIPALLNKADLYRSFGQEKQSEQFIRQAIQLAPDSAAAFHALGLLQVRQNKTELALLKFKRSIELAPNNSRYRYIYAVSLQNQNNTKEAIQQLALGLKYQPYNTDMLQFIVNLLKSQGRILEAENYSSRLSL